MIELLHGDCLKEMKKIEDNSIDLVLTDPPYGTTSIKWDHVLDYETIWAELNRILKDNTTTILFGSQPFTSQLICSNLEWFKYELIWNKNKCGSPGLAKKRPMKVHENIIIFNKGTKTTYNPIMEAGAPYERNCKNPEGYGSGVNRHGYGFGKKKVMSSKNNGTRYPKSILHASRNFSAQQTVHPTQKPTNLLSWLIMTYSNPGDTVLDFTMGSGSTGVSCKKTGRSFIGIENDAKYYELARQRIDDTLENTTSRDNHQLTTQLHPEMKTSPDKK